MHIYFQARAEQEKLLLPGYWQKHLIAKAARLKTRAENATYALRYATAMLLMLLKLMQPQTGELMRYAI